MWSRIAPGSIYTPSIRSAVARSVESQRGNDVATSLKCDATGMAQQRKRKDSAKDSSCQKPLALYENSVHICKLIPEGPINQAFALETLTSVLDTHPKCLREGLLCCPDLP